MAAIVKDFKIKNFFPFYLDKINKKFFNQNQKNQLFCFYNNKQEKKTPLFAKQNILSHKTIAYLLNRTLQQINHTQNSFFLNNPNKGFVFINQQKEELSNITNLQTHNRYFYYLNINPDCYLFQIFQKIEIAFYIDKKNQRITGGFSLDNSVQKLVKEFDLISKKIYFNALLINFFTKELFPISLNNLLSILDLYAWEDITIVKQKKKWATKKPLMLLYEKWNSFCKAKIDCDKWVWHQKDFTHYFYAFLNTIVLCLILYEELKNYFNNKNPENYCQNNTLTKTQSIPNSSCKQDFYTLIAFVKKNYFYFGKEESKTWKKQTTTDVIESLVKFDLIENAAFGHFNTYFEFTRHDNIPFFDEDDDFLKSDKLKLLFLLIFKSEILGINISTYDFLEYEHFAMNLNKFVCDANYDLLISQMIDSYICEWNYDYASFIKDDFTTLIIKNNNDELPQESLYDNYMWTFIFCTTLIWKLKKTEQNLQIYKNTKPWILRGLIQKIDYLRIDWYASFYELYEIKQIIKKVNEFYDFNHLIEILKKKIIRYDKIYGKNKERKNIVITFFSAGVFGLIDFFTMIYSVLTVQERNIRLTTSQIIIISIATVFIVLLIAIFTYNMVKIFHNKKQETKYG